MIKTYYAYPTEEEGNPTFAIQTKELGNGAVEITLIHEGLADDSQSGRKIVMTAQQTGQRWTVSSIKENWKCWEGRGHTTWGTEPCK